MKLFKLLIIVTAILFTQSVFAEVETNKKAPNFEATDINNKKLALKDFLGKLVVLEWHNPNCPFVVKHYDSNNMQMLQKKYTEKGVVWLTINSAAKGNSGAFDNAKVNKYLSDKKGMATNYISDFSGEIGKAYGARTTPHMYIIDKEGELAYQGAIDSNSSAKPETIKGATNYVSKALDELLMDKKVSQNETEPYGCSVKY